MSLVRVETFQQGQFETNSEIAASKQFISDKTSPKQAPVRIHTICNIKREEIMVLCH